MNLEVLIEQLEIDEGLVEAVYLDHLGLKTCGIGHLCRKNEPEYDMEVGDPVSRERINELFNEDVESVLSDCNRLYPDFDELPEEAKQIICNMMFNMGLGRLSAFKGMKRGVDARDWESAANEMVDSKWYTQVTNRAERLVERMRQIQ
jgi:lysozyme